MTKTPPTIQQLWKAQDYQALEALLCLQRHAALDDDTLVWSALCAQVRGDLHSAYRYLVPVVSSGAGKSEALGLLGRIADGLELPSLRLHAWQMAVTADPLNTLYRQYLARVHRDMGNPDMAAAVMAPLQKLARPLPATPPADFPLPDAPPLPRSAVVVLIPVYDDYAVTRQCIEQVLAFRSANKTPMQLLLINDASPSEELSRWLRTLPGVTRSDGIELIEHSRNQGFIHTVNRGLSRYPDHDVVLLNADTLVHHTWLDRLQQAAHSADDIASVTPLSNFGELVSYPRPMYDNPLLGAGQVATLDGMAMQLNGPETIPIPVGVGFCMYVRKEALAAVGSLNATDYRRGYGEEVDLCLRFGEAGLQNVCASNVYVGHRGSRSFKAEKPLLAAHNNAILARRYPRYRASYNDFLRRDPLTASRSRIARAQLLAGNEHYHLCWQAPREPAADRLKIHCASQGQALLMAARNYGRSGDGWDLLVINTLGTCTVQFSSRHKLDELLATLQQRNRLQTAPPAPEPVIFPLQSNQATDKVIAVMATDNPAEAYPLVHAMAQHIAARQLPITLWLQYRTLNDAALQHLGCVDAGNYWPTVDLNLHLTAGGASALWYPQPSKNKLSDVELEAIINEW